MATGPPKSVAPLQLVVALWAAYDLPFDRLLKKSSYFFEGGGAGGGGGLNAGGGPELTPFSISVGSVGLSPIRTPRESDSAVTFWWRSRRWWRLVLWTRH